MNNDNNNIILNKQDLETFKCYTYKGYSFYFANQVDGTILTYCDTLPRDYILLGGINLEDAYNQIIEIINKET